MVVKVVKVVTLFGVRTYVGFLLSTLLRSMLFVLRLLVFLPLTSYSMLLPWLFVSVLDFVVVSVLIVFFAVSMLLDS